MNNNYTPCEVLENKAIESKAYLFDQAFGTIKYVADVWLACTKINAKIKMAEMGEDPAELSI